MHNSINWNKIQTNGREQYSSKGVINCYIFMCAEVCTGDHLDSSFSVVAGINYFVFWLKKWVWIYE